MRFRSQCRALPALCLVGLLFQNGCARNPVTGRLQLALISEAQEIQIGEESADEVTRSIGLVDDPALQSYVQGLGRRLAAESERPDLPWTFGVVDDPTPNAFALPGGFVYLTRGMMSLMGTEAQLVTVLGHEVGHVTARHHVSSMSRAQLAQLGLGIGGILAPQLEQLGGIAGAGLQLLFLSHGREAERQADDLGFRYALDDGFDVREMALVFSSLERLGDEQQRSAIPSWLLTHPAPGERIQAVEERLAAIREPPGQLRIGRMEYLDRIDGLVYGANPRDGFFRDGLFLHPDVRFQIGFPGSWQHQNLRQAVMAVSPQQDAAIQLTFAGDATPDAAANRFLSQQGIQRGQTARQTINGLSAVVASFRAQSQQQTLQGIVAFIGDDSRVYEIIGYSPVGVYSSYDDLFRQTLRSFAPLTDPQALDVQPDRIAIVRTTEAMTLAEFDRRFPSAIPIDQLVILNQVDGPDVPLPAGSLVKRVVAG